MKSNPLYIVYYCKVLAIREKCTFTRLCSHVTLKRPKYDPFYIETLGKSHWQRIFRWKVIR